MTALLRWVHALDLRLYARVARYRHPLVDRLLPWLSRAADRSLAWLAIAGAVAAVGGEPGRRAGRRAVVAIGVTSALVNGPLKLAARRTRPDRRDVPVTRQVPIPFGTSFPSGHAASSAAFATAMSAELPVLAPVLAPLAAAVGVSRITTGVHYPSDVAVGASIGIAVALVLRRLAR